MILLRYPLGLSALFSVSLASMLAACGNKVVVDANGTSGGGGAGGGAASTTSVTSSSSSSEVTASASVGVGGSGGCSGLQEDLLAKVAAAQACNPALSIPQCSGGTTVNDLCGCSVAANDSNPMAAESATAAFNAWVKAGCGPFACLLCPPPPPAPWHCDPTSAVCEPTFVK